VRDPAAPARIGGLQVPRAPEEGERALGLVEREEGRCVAEDVGIVGVCVDLALPALAGIARASASRPWASGPASWAGREPGAWSMSQVMWSSSAWRAGAALGSLWLMAESQRNV
jgi:hypothetical protein